MKFATVSLAAVAALALSVGSASAGPPGHYHGSGYGYNPRGGHLDYHNGHYHYHNGHYRSGPLVPVYPSYSYPSYNYGYNSGFGLTINRPGFSFGIGSGSVTPYYNYGYSQPYYGGWRR
jgi:hypothetical protein